MASYLTLTSKDGGQFGAYRSLPAHPNGGAILVLHDMFGINANIRSIIDGFADMGFVAIAPDLFWRQEAGLELDPAREEDRARAQRLRDGLNETRATQDAQIAVEHIRSLPRTNGRVGVVGYCLGGRLAFILSTSPDIAASICYYGSGIQNLLGLTGQIRSQLLLHLASENGSCPPEAQAQIIAQIDGRSERHKVMLHTDAPHAFARRGGPNYDLRTAARANAATMALLRSAVVARA